MIDRDEYAVRLMDLPEGVGGFVTESPDGFLNIYINARHGWKGQRKSFRHELRHAEGDDLHSTEPLAVIEARADGTDVRLKTIPHLMRARDLMPTPVHADSKPETVKLSPHQLRALMSCLAELDKGFFSKQYDY